MKSEELGKGYSAIKLIESENYWEFANPLYNMEDIDALDRIDLYPYVKYIEKRNKRVSYVAMAIASIILIILWMIVVNPFLILIPFLENVPYLPGILLLVIMFLLVSQIEKIKNHITVLDVNSILDQCGIEKLKDEVIKTKRIKK